NDIAVPDGHVGERPGNQTAHYLITVHGTGDTEDFSDGQKWWQRGSNCSEGVLRRLRGGRETTLLPFIWDSANSQQSRVKAGNELAQTVNDLPPDASISILAHSHGGNVVLYALSRIKNVENRLKKAVLVGTPPLAERSKWLMLGYFIAGLIVTALSIAPLFTLWDGYLDRVFGLLFLAGLAVFVPISLWLINKPDRFDTAASVILVIGIVLLLGLFLSKNDWFTIGVLALYGFVCCLVGLALIRRSINTFYREWRKRRSVKLLKDRLHILLHSKDEAFGLLRKLREFHLNIAAPDQMSRTLAGTFLTVALYCAFIMFPAWYVYQNSNVGQSLYENGVIASWETVLRASPLLIDAAGILILLLAPVYLLARMVTKFLGGRLGRWTSNSLNRRITSTAVAAALGDDTDDQLVFDEQLLKDGLEIVRLPLEVEEEMLERACEEASVTAAKLVREGLAHRIGDKDFISDASQLITFKELMHCGYFDNEAVLDEIVALLESGEISHTGSHEDALVS
ncbi:MAG: hypothetical protein AAFV54_12185, partial [Pseudomonadota bacterium]